MNWRFALLALGGFVVVYLALVVCGVVPLESLAKMIQSAVGSPAGWRNTLRQATPLLILGAAVFVALRAGLFNIGADGQFVMGAMSGTAVALANPGPLGMVLGMAVGALVGALWALPAGWIKAYRGGHEVITTIMLNNIARVFSLWMVTGIMKDPDEQASTTKYLPAESLLPVIYREKALQINLALLFGILVVVGLWFYLKKTVSGYELEATGGNPTAARFAGIAVKQVTLKAMCLSGALAGFAGAVQVLAYEERFYGGFSGGVGFDALGVALLAAGSPMALLPSALLFGVIAQGTTALSLDGVPKGMSGILLGVLIIVFAAFRYRKEAARD